MDDVGLGANRCPVFAAVSARSRAGWAADESIRRVARQARPCGVGSSAVDSNLLLSGTELGTLIRSRRVSSREVVEAHIRQIERVNPQLNAVVCTRFEEARREADDADRMIAAGDGEDRPFLGVPCSIKECFALEGMPNTSGLVARRGTLATSDAGAVRRLRAAGAIPLGVTNLSELCMWMESNNRVYGRTNNPYDLKRIPGGSSGGEGAIIGAGGVPFGLGSDVGGSIRMPAFFNGIFGHKPTGGLVDNSGQFPATHGVGDRYLTSGPLARRAADLAPLLSVLASADIGIPAEVSLADLDVVCIETDGRTPVDDELCEAQRSAARALERRGARTRTAKLPRLKKALEIWSAMMEAAGGPTFRELLGNGKAIMPALELLAWAFGRSAHTLPALGLALVERVPKLFPRSSARAIEEGKLLKHELNELVGPRGVLLYPPYSSTAPRHNEPLRSPLRWVYAAVFNVMEMPVTAVPLGLSASGMPLGVQVAATPGNDHVTIAVALALEAELGGWVPPPLAQL
ncbi:MAG: amidase [Myxococcales bacterium]|nr:amidase [Myxococcales bacterium]